MSTSAFTRLSVAAAAWLALAGPALALYKVVGPDGKVTYTDRPPPADAGRVQPLRPDATPADPAAGLPGDLREALSRFPVTLYATTDCSPCDNGRRLLLQRGVPFTERLVSSEDDADAMQRITGGRTVPSLTIGSQALRGYAEADWQAYLDAAGYPRESKLPRNFAQPAPQPLTQRRPEPAPRNAAPRAAAAPGAASAAEAERGSDAPTPANPPPAGIRF